MPIPTWSVGQVLAASDVNTWFVPLETVKPSDQSLTSNTTMQNDTALLLPVAANAYYYWQLFMLWEGSATASQGIQWQWTSPAGATVRYGGNGGTSTVLTGASVVQAQGSGAGTVLQTQLNGFVTTTGTAGNLQFQWAQWASSGTATIVHQNSCLLATRLS